MTSIDFQTTHRCRASSPKRKAIEQLAKHSEMGVPAPQLRIQRRSKHFSNRTPARTPMRALICYTSKLASESRPKTPSRLPSRQHQRKGILVHAASVTETAMLTASTRQPRHTIFSTLSAPSTEKNAFFDIVGIEDDACDLFRQCVQEDITEIDASNSLTEEVKAKQPPAIHANKFDENRERH